LLDVFTGPRELEATLPGGGTLLIAGSRIPGEFRHLVPRRRAFPRVGRRKAEKRQRRGVGAIGFRREDAKRERFSHLRHPRESGTSHMRLAQEPTEFPRSRNERGLVMAALRAFASFA
jgi:hypothetical protein